VLDRSKLISPSRRTSTQMLSTSQDVLYEDGDPMSASSSTSHSSPLLEGSSYTGSSLPRMYGSSFTRSLPWTDEYNQRWPPGASSERSRPSYQNSLTSNRSSYATSYQSAEELRDMHEGTPQQSQASVASPFASPFASPDVQSICRIMR
jgi:hypothetical protein